MSGSKTDQRFADYFVISGLDVTSGLEPDQLSGENLHCAPLFRPYKSRVLANYPDSLPWNPIDKDAIGMLCLPKGLTFRTERQSRKAKFHSFIITREDGSRLYGSSYIFYEEVTNAQICAAMQTLQHMHEAEVSNIHTQNVVSIQEPLRDQSPLLEYRIINPDDTYDIKIDKLYVTKSICLISQVQFVSAPRTFLKQLCDAVTKPISFQQPLEAYVYNLLYDVPLPPPGRSMKFYGVTSPIFCQRPMAWDNTKGTGELPLFDFSLWDLVRLLGLDHLVQLFASVLLEHQILLYSSDYHRLMLVAESINELIFPFTWQHVYVPILPASLQHFLDAPVPYIMGLHHAEEDTSKPQLPNEANLCFVDIDNNSVQVPEDLPSFPFEQELKEELYQAIVSSKERMLKETFIDSVISSPKRKPLSNKFTSVASEPVLKKAQSSPGLEKMEILQQSEAWSKISAIAKKTGVWNKDFQNYDSEQTTKIAKEETTKEKFQDLASMPSRELEELKFNNSIREIFLNRFVQMFCWYEEFVILNSQDMDSWLSNRESMQNFDKASFLSDQPETYLPFLSPFLETQMFATLIDNKILSNWEESELNLKVFHSRVKSLREGLDISAPRSHIYVHCSRIKDSEILIEKRSSYIDHIAKKPQLPEGSPDPPNIELGFFPILDKNILNSEANLKPKMKDSAKWRRKDRLLQQSEHLKLNSRQRELSLEGSVAKQTWLMTRATFSFNPEDVSSESDSDSEEENMLTGDFEKYMAEARSKSLQPRLTEMAAGGMAQTNWKFVEALLKECKTKTKRMLVEKMGQEAVELGHGEGNITGVEENTLIASLCDLLERIWSHGLQTKKGKSALWSHLQNYVEIEEGNSDTGRQVDPNLLSPVLVPKGMRRSKSLDINSFADLYVTLCNLSSMALTEGEKTVKRGHRRTGSRGNIELPVLKPLPQTLACDMRKVQEMTDIKTDVGCARAWVRLSLEKKMLSTHLKELLSDSYLLRSLYKRYAFLRCEDEREQFLYHLLSLNAMDYFCFTNAYINTVVPYRVLLYPSLKFGCTTTSANPWITFAGHMGETGIIEIPKGVLEFCVEHKNLGVLTTLRLGHDNSGLTPKWLIEYVLIRNEISGHTYKFPCGRWLGKGVDDGSIERLLVAELLPPNTNTEDIIAAIGTPPRSRSPVSPRRPLEQGGFTIPDIQEMLGHAVNGLIKHYYKPEKERGNLTYLLCGERGLVPCIEHIFLYGFRSARIFRNKFYIWDYLEKVKTHLEATLEGEIRRPSSDIDRAGFWMFCNLLTKINNAAESVGKDGKLQIFICVAVRDHTLQKWLPMIAKNIVTAQMYEEKSFMRDNDLITFIIHILDTLNDFDIILESSLVRGLNI
ncbi:DENN domain-containing protein 5B-like isoform X3 [Ruditapes philippinarum]|uniref:DENN domain-containing protein 5B-like isoform X3 n=1 Tax=Ruditapes philippinarum TaxID=129788 RepID=UPI00295B97C0|nr:DENN domain-containing protein 5B-like isoform X3 [Ruditapes philippinarum]